MLSFAYISLEIEHLSISGHFQKYSQKHHVLQSFNIRRGLVD